MLGLAVRAIAQQQTTRQPAHWFAQVGVIVLQALDPVIKAGAIGTLRHCLAQEAAHHRQVGCIDQRMPVLQARQCHRLGRAQQKRQTRRARQCIPLEGVSEEPDMTCLLRQVEEALAGLPAFIGCGPSPPPV